MNAGDQLAREAESFLAQRDYDYRVVIEPARGYDWFYVHLYYRDKLIRSWSCCKSYRIARWRVRNTVRNHRRFIATAHQEGAAT